MAKKETREKILRAATKVFFENGFEATSVKIILDEANAVTGSFYHFFLPKRSSLSTLWSDSFRIISKKCR